MVTEAEQKTETIGGYTVHPFASIFPLMEGDEFDELIVSVKENGLKKRIKLTSLGVLVDGRNRLRACKSAGVDPQFEQVPEGTDIIQLIIQENVLRRHLTTSQRAMIAAELTDATAGRPKNDSQSVSLDAAAKKLKVSRSSAANGKKVLASGEAEVIDAVKSGKLDVRPAAEIAELPKEEQKLAVAEVISGTRKTRAKATDAAFKRDKWRSRAETVVSKLVAEAPADLHDWSRGVLRDITGGTLRREAKIDVPHGDDVALYDESDVINRIELMLKEIPIAERKMIALAVGCHFVGKKPDQYLPEFSAEDGDSEKIIAVVGEIRHRLKQFESITEAAKVLKTAASSLKKLTKADEE